jgi:mono/diheme cytochrome c family protein
MSVRHPARDVTRALLLGAVLAPLAGCEWFTDFKRQPSIVTWEAPDSAGVRGSPQGSVPITGSAAPGFLISYTPVEATIDSMSRLVNPTPPDSASLVNGRKLFVINCAVCHGMAGRGDGPATRYGIFPFPVVGDRARGLSDGYIFGMIRNGRGNMPSYNRIEERERWDIVNYIRGLQGALGTPVPTGPVAVPGFTGPAMPGPTPLAPTRPVPHSPAAMAAMGARPDTVSRDTTTGPASDTTRSGAPRAPRGGDRQ